MSDKGIKSLQGYPLIDSKCRNAVDDTRSNLENNYQKKEDDTLGTTAKTVAGSINELILRVQTLEEKVKTLSPSTPETTTTNYSVTYELNDSTSSNNEVKLDKWTNYSTEITPRNGYKITSIDLFMDRDDWTDDYVNRTKIDIPVVIGDIVIVVNTQSNDGTQSNSTTQTQSNEVVYDNPTVVGKDYKVIISQDGYTETYNGSSSIDTTKYPKFKAVYCNGDYYYIGLTSKNNGSKFRIEGLRPINATSISHSNTNGGSYDVLTAMPIPLMNNNKWIFSTTMMIQNNSLDKAFVQKGLDIFNSSLPALNATITDSSPNVMVGGDYSTSWYGLRTGAREGFNIKINSGLLKRQLGELYDDNNKMNVFWLSTLVHELGHCLGLEDNATHNPSLMSYSRNKTKCYYLEANDLHELNFIYMYIFEIDISKSQEDITKQVVKLGLVEDARTIGEIDEDVEYQISYPHYDTEEELNNASDIILTGKLSFKENRDIDLSSDNSLVLNHKVYEIQSVEITKGTLNNTELKIHISENINIDENKTYKLYLKQYDNCPNSLVNIEQGIKVID